MNVLSFLRKDWYEVSGNDLCRTGRHPLGQSILPHWIIEYDSYNNKINFLRGSAHPLKCSFLPHWIISGNEVLRGSAHPKGANFFHNGSTIDLDYD